MLCLYQTNFAQVSWTTVVSTWSVLSVVVEILRQLQHTSSSSSPASDCPHFSISFASFSSDTAFSNVTFCYTCSSTCHCPSQEFRVQGLNTHEVSVSISVLPMQTASYSSDTFCSRNSSSHAPTSNYAVYFMIGISDCYSLVEGTRSSARSNP